MLFKKLLQSDGKEVSRTEKTLALTIASTVNTLLSLLLSMAAARVLSKTEIAVNSQTFLAYSTFSPFLTLGINSGIYYYLAQNERRKRAAVNECMTLVSASSLLFALFICFGGNNVLAAAFKNPGISQTLYYMIPYTLLITPASVLSYVFVYENRLRFNAVFSTIQTFTILVVVLLFMLWFRTGQSMVVSRVLVSCAFALVTVYLAYSILPKGGERPDWKNMRRLLALSLPLGISSVMGTLDRNLDQWIVSTILTPEIYAVYTQGARELPLIGTITGSINTVLVVDLTKAVQEKNYQEAARLFRRVAEKTSMLLMPIMVFCFAAAKPIISFLYTDAYLDAVPVFQIYLLYMPIRVVYYGPFLIALGKSRFVMWETAGALFVNAAFSVFFVYLFHAEGAALATVLSVYCFNVPLNLYIISKETGISWKLLLPFKQVLLCIAYSIPGVVLCTMAGDLLMPRMSALGVLIAEFFIFAAISLPLFSWRFHISLRRFAEKLYARFRF